MSEVVESTPKTLEYDVCLSFAGEKRKQVQRVAAKLGRRGIKVFMDDLDQANMWARDLVQYLGDVFENKSKLCVAFLSPAYMSGKWTGLELEHALARAKKERDAYLLITHFEGTPVPKALADKSYVTYETPRQMANLIEARVVLEPAVLRRRRMRRKLRMASAIVAGLLLVWAGWYVDSHWHSHTSVVRWRPDKGPKARYVNVQLKNPGWEPSTLVDYRLTFENLPVEPVVLVNTDDSKKGVPARGSLALRLSPKEREVIPVCVNGTFPTIQEITNALDDKHRVTLEIGVRESGRGTVNPQTEPLNAKEFTEFIEHWWPPKLPPHC